MDPRPWFDACLAHCPLIAILRGVQPEQAVQIGDALFQAGFRIIEVPLNSPLPFDSIEKLVRTFGDRAIIGAGTVTTVDEVRELARIGARAVISPHADLAVIEATVRAGLVSLPGIMSPTEAFAALKAGAHALKLFPMEVIGAAGVKAMRAVLPKTTRLIAVGGVG
ncbi:MAG: 2-dehydro-3-deoxy-6-phosphogalactonate aldolase, partial [Beijerinckiaceae bacterium]